MNKRPGKYIYSYDYEPNESWSSDGSVEVDTARVEAFMKRTDVVDEIAKTAQSIREAKGGSANKVIFTLLSDTHYVINGNWEYTASTLEAVYSRLREEHGLEVDGIIHLGDLTDGILSREICSDYSHRVLDELSSFGKPVVIAVGNHDSNYFRGNSEIMDETMQYNMYVDTLVKNNAALGVTTTVFEASKLCYRTDLPKHNLVMFSLSAYDNSEKNRYGFSLEQIDWLKDQLSGLEEGKRVIILSHDAPLTHLDFWAKEIRNGELLCDALDEWNICHDRRIVGFFHGHTHADFVCSERSYPIISVACSKIEYFEDKKPEGSIVPVRYEDEVTQELWDTLVLDVETGDMDMIRFGAGFDRRIKGYCGSKVGIGIKPEENKLEKRYLPRPAIWGHRGESGYAPENTLEAFELAMLLGADGIELDVQFTKDRQIVVIHDERIDRTSNGTGFVCDYTFEELRKFNFNKTHPEYDHCDIPLLKEVLELIKPSSMVINIELKTGINLYPGIEREVVEIVRQYGMEDRVIYSSFNHGSVCRAHSFTPVSKCGFLYPIGIVDVVDYAIQNEIHALHPDVNCMKDLGFVESCHYNNIDINVWTVNTPYHMEQMRQYGVHAIITNHVEIARQVYDGHELGYIINEYIERYKTQKVEENNLNNVSKETTDELPVPQKKQNVLLHMAGIGYKYIRKPFVAIDRIVQRAAGNK